MMLVAVFLIGVNTGVALCVGLDIYLTRRSR